MMKLSRMILYLMPLSMVLSSCGNDDTPATTTTTSESTDTTVTFPNIAALISSTIPNFVQSSFVPLSLVRKRDYVRTSSQKLFAFPDGSTLDNASEWATAVDDSNNTLGVVLGNYGENGPVKSIFVVMDNVQGTFDSINDYYLSSSGDFQNCTTIPSSTSITIPYWSSRSTTLATFSDSDKFQCYDSSDGSTTLMGRAAIASPPADCSDPYTYYVASGYYSDGASLDLTSILRFKFNGCTYDLDVQYAQQTLYATGVEFSSATEISGNASTANFSLVSGYIDVMGSPSDSTMAISIAGKGVSRKLGDINGNLLIGYRKTDCNGASCDVDADGTPEDKNFCAKNDSDSASGVSHDSDSTNCSSHLSAYSALPIYDSFHGASADIPRSMIDTRAAAFGL